MKHHLLEFSRYFVASAIALAVDFALYGALIYAFHVQYLIAAAVGFLAGLVCVYLLSVRMVFTVRRISHEGLEFFLFAVIGVFGLIQTEGFLLLFIDYMNINLLIAKMITAGTVFCSNYLFRKFLLFR